MYMLGASGIVPQGISCLQGGWCSLGSTVIEYEIFVSGSDGTS
jgi:hypothetical protein